jgi:hypothetical protein
VDEATVLSGVNRWVGVVVALVGTIVVAPSGWTLLLQSISQFTEEWLRAARTQISRIVPWLRPKPTSVSMSARVGGSASLSASARISVAKGWNPTAPVDARIEILLQRIIEAEGQLDAITRNVSDESSARKAAIEEVERKFQTETRALRSAIENQERYAALLDARGLPSLAIGIVLSGVPDDLARIPLHLGWLLPVIGVAAALLATVGAIRSRARSLTHPNEHV